MIIMNQEFFIHVSVIIVSYNQEALLRNCLSSIYQYTQEILFEIIVVDNASKPSIGVVMKREFPAIKWIQLAENVGFAAANNYGAKQATGQELFFLNSDTLFPENVLRKLIDYKGKHPEIGLLGPRLVNNDGSLQIQGSILGAWQFWGIKPRALRFLSGAALMINRSFFHEIAGFDEFYFFYNEDVDLCKTVMYAKRAIIYFPQAFVIHLGGGSTSSFNFRLKLSAYQGALHVCYKFYPKWIFFVYFAIIRLDVLGKIVYNILLIRKAQAKAYQEIFHELTLENR